MASVHTDTDLQHRLNHETPAAANAHLGDVIYDLINNYNALNTKYLALLAHMDAANVSGLGNAHVTTYGGTSSVTLPAAR